jgi:uncharacterized membrane protein YqjE
VHAHIVEGVGAVAGATALVLVRVIWLIAFAIEDDARWRRFRNLALFGVFLLLAIASAAGWWLLGDGGLQILTHQLGGPSGAELG